MKIIEEVTNRLLCFHSDLHCYHIVTSPRPHRTLTPTGPWNPSPLEPPL